MSRAILFLKSAWMWLYEPPLEHRMRLAGAALAIALFITALEVTVS